MTRSYERWREVTEDHERSFKRHRKGFLAVRVVIEPDKFLAWCAARAIEPNANAIGKFINDAVGYKG
jgi:hypothetical protein